MSAHDLKTLQDLYRRMRELELRSRDGDFSIEALAEIQKSLGEFANHEIFEWRKLAEIPKHLHPQMSLKHYVSWLVPLERLLQRELRDDEFLISTQDQASISPLEKIPLVLILHNLRSAFNVGSIFRTAECFGLQKIYLCGYTPLPTQTKLLKTAMGTEQWVSWEEVPSLEDLLQKLKPDFQLVAFETSPQAKALYEAFPKKPTAFVFGNERFGLESSVLAACHEVRQIPVRGQKNSLNVGVASAIATAEFARQWGLS